MSTLPSREPCRCPVLHWMWPSPGTALPGMSDSNTLDSRFCKACGTLLVTSDAPPPAQRSTPSQSYTPRHLADKILAIRSALEGERKQVTVLFADVVGFSTLAGPLDPEDVHTLMDGCFAILTQQVHRYEGTINQFTGDGIMALFGAPLMHEDHAVRALHAALGIQAALQDYREEVQAPGGCPSRCASGLTPGWSSWAASAMICAWTTRPKEIPRTWRHGCNRWRRQGQSGWARRRIASPARPLSGRRWERRR